MNRRSAASRLAKPLSRSPRLPRRSHLTRYCSTALPSRHPRPGGFARRDGNEAGEYRPRARPGSLDLTLDKICLRERPQPQVPRAMAPSAAGWNRFRHLEGSPQAYTFCFALLIEFKLHPMWHIFDVEFIGRAQEQVEATVRQLDFELTTGLADDSSGSVLSIHAAKGRDLGVGDVTACFRQLRLGQV